MTKRITKADQRSRRLRERIRLTLPARVSVRESTDNEWTASTRLVDVTPFGARFSLSRPIDIGRLLRLTVSIPRQLRIFDFVEDQYRVWAIVRNVKLLEQTTRKDPLVEVGVAFIGKRPPDSYEENPEHRYQIAQSKLENAAWAAHEDSVEQLAEVKTGDKLFTSMDVRPGAFVKVTSERYKTTVLAIVRARRAGQDGITRLHREFVGSEWPLECVKY